MDLSERILPPFLPRVVVEAAIEAGADRTALFEGLSLSAADLDVPEARLSMAELNLLISNAMRLGGGPSLALRAGERVHLTSLGLLGAAVMSSSDGAQALATLARHWASISPCLLLFARHEGDRVRIEVRPTVDLPCVEFVMDTMLLGLALQAEFVFGRPAPVLEASTIAPRAPHRFKRLVEVAGVKCTFGADKTEVVLDAEILRWPCRHAEPNTQALAERMHVQSMRTGSVATDEPLAKRVERVLNAAEHQPPSVSEVARRLGTSARTLRRTLAADGTSFRALREASLHRRAQELLEAGELSQTQISDRLGYADVRAFRRAFKRWTGHTPASVRLKLANRSGAAMASVQHADE